MITTTLEKRHATQKRWRIKNPHYQRDWKRNYRTTNPEKYHEYRQAYNSLETTQTRNKNNRLQRVYGITFEEYNEIFEKQNKKCASCESTDPGTKKGWHIDHDHKTGKVRGILCHKCNVTLGMAKENPQVLQKLITYLENFR